MVALQTMLGTKSLITNCGTDALYYLLLLHWTVKEIDLISDMF